MSGASQPGLVLLLIALASGLLVGVERGWRQRERSEGERIAGVRTFALLGGVGGTIGLFSESGQWVIASLLAASVLTVLAILTLRSLAREGNASATNFVAMVLTLAMGMLSTTGQPELALALAAATTLILSLRIGSHALLARLEDADVRALATFAIVTLAILPFLPDRGFGPYAALNPRHLWMVVVIVTGLSFLGYAANRVFGTRHGMLITAVVGGLYSSTAVTLAFSRRLALTDDPDPRLCAGITLASGLMLVRTVALVALVAPFALVSVSWMLLPPYLCILLSSVVMVRNLAPRHDAPAVTTSNPVEIMPAMVFAALVAFAAIAARWAEDEFGGRGIAALLLVTGFLDVDAATVTLGNLPAQSISPEFAGVALAGPLFANTLVKGGIVATVAGWRKGRPALLALVLGATAMIASAAQTLLR